MGRGCIGAGAEFAAERFERFVARGKRVAFCNGDPVTEQRGEGFDGLFIAAQERFQLFHPLHQSDALLTLGERLPSQIARENFVRVIVAPLPEPAHDAFADKIRREILRSKKVVRGGRSYRTSAWK